MHNRPPRAPPKKCRPIIISSTGLRYSRLTATNRRRTHSSDGPHLRMQGRFEVPKKRVHVSQGRISERTAISISSGSNETPCTRSSLNTRFDMPTPYSSSRTSIVARQLFGDREQNVGEIEETSSRSSIGVINDATKALMPS